MLLRTLSIRGFRCYDEILDIPMHRLTVFIGGNDAGKTVILEALNLLLTNSRPSEHDYHERQGESKADAIEITGKFALDEYDSVPQNYQGADGCSFTLRKTFTELAPCFEVDGLVYVNPAYQTFARQPAEKQRQLLTDLSLEPASNTSSRLEQFRRADEEGLVPKKQAMAQVQWPDIESFLPRVEFVSSADYQQPDAMISRTLQSAINSFLKPLDSTGKPHLRSDLAALEGEIQEELNNKVAEMTAILRDVNPSLHNIAVEPRIDFTRSIFGTSLMLDTGGGLHYVSSFGEGTKKKLWMGLLEWQRRTQELTDNTPVLRVYDEPDVNLDYQAQRKLFSNILDAATESVSPVQTVVCTHAVTFINQAPPKSINHIKVCDDGSREIRYAKSEGSEDVQELLAVIGQSMGISNMSFFYDRAFLVVEGESEECALPTLYRNLYGRTLKQDGILLVNLHTNSAWKAVLKFLHHNRAEVTVLLLDRDCITANGTGIISSDDLRQIGFPDDFLSTNCHFIGEREFEDAFRTSDIVTVLNDHWPKLQGGAWTDCDVDQFRVEGHKFSSELRDHVRQHCEYSVRGSVRKPDIAQALARHCVRDDQVPDLILQVFRQIRMITGVE